MSCLRRVCVLPLLVLLSGAQLIGAEPLSQTPVWTPLGAVILQAMPKDWQWHVAGGYAWRQLGALEFATRSQALAGGLSPFVAGTSSQLGAAGPATGYAVRNYSDGFVRPDFGTGIGGDTGFFSYQQNSQEQGGFLVFHGEGTSRTAFTESLQAGESGWSSDLGGGGPVLELAVDGALTSHLRVGASMSLGLWVMEAAHEGLGFSARQLSQGYTSQVTDAYDTLGAALPGAPYTGSFAGAGPVILATPARSVQESLDSSSRAWIEDVISQDLDLVLTTLSLGPTLAYEHGPLSLKSSLGLAVNVAAWEASQTERLRVKVDNEPRHTVAEWHDHDSGTEVLPGFYLQLGAEVQLSPGWAVQLMGRYDWARELEGEVGGSSFQLPMNGWSVAAMVRYAF